MERERERELLTFFVNFLTLKDVLKIKSSQIVDKADESLTALLHILHIYIFICMYMSVL